MAQNHLLSNFSCCDSRSENLTCSSESPWNEDAKIDIGLIFSSNTSRANQQNVFTKKAWIHWCVANCNTLSNNMRSLNSARKMSSQVKIRSGDGIATRVHIVYNPTLFWSWQSIMQHKDNLHPSCNFKKFTKIWEIVLAFFLYKITNNHEKEYTFFEMS